MTDNLAAGFNLDDWLVLPEQSFLASPQGDIVKVTPRTMQVLVCLASRPGQVISRDTFSEKVWAPAVVSDDALNRCISDLRNHLGDNDPSSRMIETVPKLGYRLVAKVRPVTPDSEHAPKVPATRHNLPVQRSSFIGRETDIEAISELIAHNELVTITGVGGAGKTRLALATAERMLDKFVDGTFLVDLSSLSDEQLIPQTLMEAMGLTSDRASLQGIKSYLRSRRVLLIFDNCEHLIDSCADLVDSILLNCSGVKILATSREALSIEGEKIYRIPSLSLPSRDTPAENCEAVRLFEERAKAVSGQFVISASNAEIAAKLCQRLDGIPLAIELAAARTSHLSLEDIAERLDNRFQLLTGGHRRRAQRQQTLQAAIDWSYELLTPEEQAFFRQISVFSGSFSLEAVEGICQPALAMKSLAIDLLASLTAKSLLVSGEQDGVVRYRLLETIRDYAAERLVESGKAVATRDRHCEWFVDLVCRYSLDELTGDIEVPSILLKDLENLRAAMDWAESSEQWDKAVYLVTRTAGVWFWLTNPEEGSRRLKSLLARPEISEAQRFKCRSSLAFQAMGAADWLTVYNITVASEPPEDFAEHATLWLMCRAAILSASRKKHGLAHEAFLQTIEQAKKHRQSRLEGITVPMLVSLEVRQGDVTRAIDRGESTKASGAISELFLRYALSGAYLVAKDPEGVIRQADLLKQYVSEHEMHYSPFISHLHFLEAQAAIAHGNLELAERKLVAAAQDYFETPYPMLETSCVMEFAALCMAESNLPQAHYLLNSIRHRYNEDAPFRTASAHTIFLHYEEQLKQLAQESCTELPADTHAASIKKALKVELDRRIRERGTSVNNAA